MDPMDKFSFLAFTGSPNIRRYRQNKNRVSRYFQTHLVNIGVNTDINIDITENVSAF